MSMFEKLFGGSKSAAPKSRSEDTAATIQKIQGVVELLEKKSEHLHKKIMMELVEAKKCHTAKNKPGAIQHMKRKVRYEKQKQQTDGQIDTLHAQIDAIESMAMSRQVIEATKLANTTFKQEMQDADQVQDMLSDLGDNMQQYQEISAMLAGSEIQGVFDEDELLAELEGLEQDDLDSQLQDLSHLPAAPEEVPMPPVPEHAPAPAAKAKTKQQTDLEELASWAS